jgi:hypothetical protein
MFLFLISIEMILKNEGKWEKGCNRGMKTVERHVQSIEKKAYQLRILCLPKIYLKKHR